MTNPRKATLAALFLLLVSGAVYPQTESVFKRLSGSWSGEGKAMGMPATLRMTWDWVLARSFSVSV